MENKVTYEYVEHEKVKLIEIKIKKINQLFNSFDPSPFLEKDLDDDAFEYIYSSVAEHHLSTRQKIIIYMPASEKRRVSEHEIRRGIHNFFDYKRNLAEKNIKLNVQEGELSFVVGIGFLAGCLVLSNYLEALSDTLTMMIIVEGLVIGGWVAMWKPISTLLYDWWPLHKEKKIFAKIAQMEIEFRFT